MEIELYSVLSAIIVLATAFTVLFALASYVAFRIRQKASMALPQAPVPVREAPKVIGEPEFFRPYSPKGLR
jgi:hypothetical protein